ncbi:hypothetical protein GQ44DRAFT_721914 [Phaeosphaeriaceae sp. PMI808]|nr:hypothetical protein GQ44DRAFT_721914 [Phaeosphaeriaceae sp. PMI808]
MIKTIFLLLITLFVPPVGVFLVAGCDADLFINIALTLLGYFPGHIHAFYIEYVYTKRRDEIKAGIYDAKPTPGVYSHKVLNGGLSDKKIARGQQAQQEPAVPAVVPATAAPAVAPETALPPPQGQVKV